MTGAVRCHNWGYPVPWRRGDMIMAHPLRVLLADDHEALRQGLRALLSATAGYDVVDDVGDGETAIARVRALAPDLLVLDLAMPHEGGLPTIRRLRGVAAKTAIVVLTRYREEAFVREALSAGASAYVLKQSSFSELQDAITHAVRGQQYVDRRLAPLLERRRRCDPPPRLGPRERDVLRRAARGDSNKEVATALGIAVKTVEVHKTQGMRKLSLRDRRDLIRYAVLQGWLNEP